MTILSDVKKVLGITDAAFDDELLTHISGALSAVKQLGVESFDGIYEIDETTEWPGPGTEFLPKYIVSVYKTLIPLRVRLSFDPPAHGTLYGGIEKTISEFESRLTLYISELDLEDGPPPEPIDPSTVYALLTSNVFTGDQNFSGNQIQAYTIREVVAVVEDTYEIDVLTGTLFVLTVVNDVVITFTNAPDSPSAVSTTVILIQSNGGGHQVVFDGSLWDGGTAPDLARPNGFQTDLSFIIRNGGQVRGYEAAINMS